MSTGTATLNEISRYTDICIPRKSDSYKLNLTREAIFQGMAFGQPTVRLASAKFWIREMRCAGC